MKDAVFSGPDVAAALQAAARDLGVPAHSLRHVVLEPGGPGSPARVAVLLDAPAPRRAEPAPPPGPSSLEGVVRDVAQALARALESSVEVALDERDGRLAARFHGAGIESLQASDPEAFEALAELVSRMGCPGDPRRVRVEGQDRQRRDARLREQALELVRAVRADGRPRETAPLNSYERRIVHLVAEETGGVVSSSDPEAGSTRPVLLAPATPEP